MVSMGFPGGVREFPIQGDFMNLEQNSQLIDKSNNPPAFKLTRPRKRGPVDEKAFRDRLAWWLETRTYGETKKLVESEKKLERMKNVDVMVTYAIMDACKKNGTQSFSLLLDRLLGKPAITADLVVTHQLGNRLDEAEKLIAMDGEFTEVDVPALPAPAGTNK